MSIPNDPGFIGAMFFQQGLVLDAAANPLGAVMSDAAAAQIGN